MMWKINEDFKRSSLNHVNNKSDNFMFSKRGRQYSPKVFNQILHRYHYENKFTKTFRPTNILHIFTKF